MRRGYWFGGLLLLAAVAGAIVFVVLRLGALHDRIESFPRTRLSEGAVMLQARDYNVYLDVPSGAGDFGWTVSFRGPAGEELSLRPAGSSFEYDLGGREGTLIGKLRVPRAGRYLVRGTGVPGARVIFGHGLLAGLGSTVLGGLAILVVLGAAGIVVIVLTAARNRPKEVKRWP